MTNEVKMKAGAVNLDVRIEVASNYGGSWAVEDVHQNMAKDAEAVIRRVLQDAKIKLLNLKVLQVMSTSVDCE